MAKNKKKETLYAISIRENKNRTLLWCDEKWYENAEGQNFVFTKEQVEKVKEYLPKHFILKATITSENGEVEQWRAFAEKEAEIAQNEATNEFDLLF